MEKYKYNPRKWTKAQKDKLRENLRELGDISGVVHDLNSDQIVGGNFRSEVFDINKCEIEIITKYDEPNAQGTVALGFVVWEGNRYNYRQVRWTKEKCDKACITANSLGGDWDKDLLLQEWGELPLHDWGVPAWNTEGDMKLTTQNRQGDEEYNAFVNKFNEEQPLTTDDCYTPPAVYDLVREFVNDKVVPLEGRKIVRPFFPGGDYTDLKQYPEGCVVLDNPPFSIYSEIVRFYLAHNIDFFLFGPQLTLFIANADVCFCLFHVPITYENGAKVDTGFVTNIRKDLRIWIEPTLRKAIQKLQKSEPKHVVYKLPDEVITAARVGKIANGGELLIGKNECKFVKNIEGMKKYEKGLFGGGFILSSAATEKARVATEKARVAAEKARAVKIELSPAELEMVAELDRLNSTENEI